METIKHDKDVAKARSLKDQLWQLYLTNYWKMEISYMTKGIRYQRKTGEGAEFMFLGNVNYNAQKGRFIMSKPEMLIGTDRLELYEFFARRREVLINVNRNWLKLAFAATLAHGVLVQVQTLFSRFFGDEVSVAEQKLGAEDQSEMGLRMSRMKSTASRKEL